MPMLEEIATRLAPYGTLATNLFLGMMPDAPHSCVTLHALPGTPPSETFAVLPHAENLTLQVLVRDPTYASAESRAREIWLDLLEVIDVPLSGHHYYRISSAQSPYLLERDETRRCIFAVNFIVMRSL